MKHYELELPQDYKVDKVIDCKNPKTAFLLTLFSFIISIAIIVLGLVISLSLSTNQETYFDGLYALLTIVFLVVYIIIIITHELIHGLFYKIFTKQKLTFGISLSAAFCGVPNVYVRKKAMIVTCMAPCVTLSVLFIILMVVFVNSPIFILFLLLFAIHFGGCVGDIYDFLLLLFKYRKKGVCQKFY